MSTLTFHWINFAILVFLLIFIMRRKLKDYYVKQREEIEEKMKEASAHEKKMKTGYKEVRQKMEQLKDKISELKKENRRQIEAGAERIKQEVSALSEKLDRDIERRCTQEVSKMSKAFEGWVLKEALLECRKAIASKMKEKDSEWTVKLIEETRTLSGKKNYAS